MADKTPTERNGKKSDRERGATSSRSDDFPPFADTSNPPSPSGTKPIQAGTKVDPTQPSIKPWSIYYRATETFPAHDQDRPPRKPFKLPSDRSSSPKASKTEPTPPPNEKARSERKREPVDDGQELKAEVKRLKMERNAARLVNKKLGANQGALKRDLRDAEGRLEGQDGRVAEEDFRLREQAQTLLEKGQRLQEEEQRLLEMGARLLEMGARLLEIGARLQELGQVWDGLPLEDGW